MVNTAKSTIAITNEMRKQPQLGSQLLQQYARTASWFADKIHVTWFDQKTIHELRNPAHPFQGDLPTEAVEFAGWERVKVRDFKTPELAAKYRVIFDLNDSRDVFNTAYRTFDKLSGPHQGRSMNPVLAVTSVLSEELGDNATIDDLEFLVKGVLFHTSIESFARIRRRCVVNVHDLWMGGEVAKGKTHDDNADVSHFEDLSEYTQSYDGNLAVTVLNLILEDIQNLHRKETVD